MGVGNTYTWNIQKILDHEVWIVKEVLNGENKIWMMSGENELDAKGNVSSVKKTN